MAEKTISGGHVHVSPGSRPSMWQLFITGLTISQHASRLVLHITDTAFACDIVLVASLFTVMYVYCVFTIPGAC